ncbi:MAG: FAD:protein FMN transferase [Cellulomonadaceae bacterium]|nr:FAD:protein FMN transferase [Cellulomonadaceae bacterium]
MGTTRRRLVANDTVMGTTVSIHVIVDSGFSLSDGASATSANRVAVFGSGDAMHDDGPRDAALHPVSAAAVAGFCASMHDDDRLFSPFRDDSQVTLLRRGAMTIDDANPRIREVEAACRWALTASGRRFDAWWEGWFNPTGYVKGWATERAFTAHLLPLLTTEASVIAVGVGVGGDLRVATRPDAAGGADGWAWAVGIVDPADSTRTIARITLTDGAVASSGTAARGSHIIDPATGAPAAVAGKAGDVASATVVADTLDQADLWATTAVIAGFDDLAWIANAHTRQGLLVAGDGRTRRWTGAAEVTLTGSDNPSFAGGLPR